MREHPFSQIPRNASEHFKLSFFGAVLHVVDQVVQTFGSLDAATEQFPFLTDYLDELAFFGVDGDAPGRISDRWHRELCDWESSGNSRLPLVALCQAAGFHSAALTMLFSIGLPEEDARFGLLFETLHGCTGHRRPTAGLVSAWWREAENGSQGRALLRQLQECGLVQVINPEAPRLEWGLQVPAILWDTIRDERSTIGPTWAAHVPQERLCPIEALVIPEILRRSLFRLPELLRSDKASGLIVRGPRRNGRRTLVGTVARLLGCDLLVIDGLNKSDDERWRLVGPLATLRHALPVLVFDLGPGEAADVPALTSYDGPVAIVLGKQGGLKGPATERAVTLTLELPDVQSRRKHWLAGFADDVADELDAISERFRMTGGNIRRAAALARSYACLDDRDSVSLADVRQACRSLNRHALEMLASPISVVGDWSDLGVSDELRGELLKLESRCRHREKLVDVVGTCLQSQLNCGVRALFRGPSGTGKTMAARLLAAALQKDLYRLDLSAVVNKYIGETEKNLNQIFTLAEELDVMLLLDEGDALLTQRTNVQSSNDRYANLETNFLLQRLETYEGILIVTTNAGERIDSAFQRRMDVVIDFRSPEATERCAIWQLHLPEAHAVEPSLLHEVASRCTLTGGQIRNAVLHAALLALNDGRVVASNHLETAVRREYQKLGAICPLRRTSLALARER